MYPSIKLPFLPYDWASISLYFLAIALGFTCAAFLMWRHARDYDIDQDRFTDFIIWMLIMGVLGSRVMHVLAAPPTAEIHDVLMRPTRQVT